MNIKNIEFKARAKDVNALERQLKSLNPVYKGMDHQVDTYFNVSKERLKLREGNIENALIHYERDDSASQKQSDVF
jgi:adenylate cyclase, class 2